jgi:F-type H+-transporting ATPase subunit delta
MAENLTIARPYAKAVFEQALTDKRLEQWGEVLATLAKVAADSQTAELLENPRVTDQQLHQLFAKITEKLLPTLAEQQIKELNNFIKILISEKRLAILPDIADRYHRLVASEQEIKEVTVTSAFPLDKERQVKLTAALTKYLHSKVTVTFQEDHSLIGGIIIRSGNWVMDSSIKGKLQYLRDSLKN